jgi:hypothetical protein
MPMIKGSFIWFSLGRRSNQMQKARYQGKPRSATDKHVQPSGRAPRCTRILLMSGQIGAGGARNNAVRHGRTEGVRRNDESVT